MKKDYTELVFILDKSGSMAGLESDTIGGYNAMLARQQAAAGTCIVTTILFNDKNDLLHDRCDLAAVRPLTKNDYQAGGTTALLDAIGLAITRTSSAQKELAPGQQAKKVLFVIITDGEENSSREFSTAKVKALIEQQKAEQGWEFIFLGANIDAVATAGSFGISANRALDYLPDRKGTSLNFAVISEAALGFRKKGRVEEGVLAKIHQDRQERGGRKARS